MAGSRLTEMQVKIHTQRSCLNFPKLKKVVYKLRLYAKEQLLFLEYFNNTWQAFYTQEPISTS